MRRILILAVIVVAFVVASFAATAQASTAYPQNYCWGYEWGQIKQSPNGNWYRCAFTGQGNTGFQWWYLG